jgi:hypothetical protein
MLIYSFLVGRSLSATLYSTDAKFSWSIMQVIKSKVVLKYIFIPPISLHALSIKELLNLFHKFDDIYLS